MKRQLLRSLSEIKGYDSIWQFLWLHEWFDPFWKRWYNLLALIETVKRMFYWGWKMRDNHDWDFHYVYIMLYYKLDRMSKAMINKGHLEWQYEENKRVVRYLKMATECARRLAFEEDNRYSHQFLDKYGFRSSWSKQLKLKSKGEPISKELYDRLYKASLDKDKNYRKYLKDNLYKALNTFGEHWWD
jgi:hypothetical protein